MKTVRYRLVLWGDRPPVILQCLEDDGPSLYAIGGGIPVGGGKPIEELMLADLPFEPLPGQGPLSLEITPVGTIESGDMLEMFQHAREDYAESKQNQTLKREPVAA